MSITSKTTRTCPNNSCDVSYDGCTSTRCPSTSDEVSCSDLVQRVQFGGSVAFSILKQSLTTCGASKPRQVAHTEIRSARGDCREKQRHLVEAVRQAATKLGSAHPLVENANKQIKEYRLREEKHRWREIVRWHKGNLAAALQSVEDGSGLTQLEDAVALANESELGGGHSLVLEANAKLLSLKKECAIQQNLALVDHHATRLHEAMLNGDLDIFARTIAEASDAIGSSHVVVEASHDFLQKQRAQNQRDDWAALVHLHDVQMKQVCEIGSLEGIEAQILTTTSALGLGHPLVQAGKAFLLQKRKLLQHEQEQRTVAECHQGLSSATAAAEVALERLEAEIVIVEE